MIGERLRWIGVLDQVKLIDGDLSDLSSVIRIVESVQPDEVYNLAAQRLRGMRAGSSRC